MRRRGSVLIGIYEDTISYFFLQILVPLKTLGFQTAASHFFEMVIGDIRIFGFQSVNHPSNFRFIKRSAHIFSVKILWMDAYSMTADAGKKFSRQAYG